MYIGCMEVSIWIVVVWRLVYVRGVIDKFENFQNYVNAVRGTYK